MDKICQTCEWWGWAKECWEAEGECWNATLPVEEQGVLAQYHETCDAWTERIDKSEDGPHG